MSVDVAGTIERRLRRLDTDRTAALVADLWAARGFETERDGDRIEATRGDRAVAIRILDSAGRRTPFAVWRAGRGVVTLTDDRSASATTADDTRVLDAADLRRMLLYAVDRETASELCQRHLGGRLDDLRSSPLVAIRSGVQALGTESAIALMAICLLVVAGVVGAAGLSFGPEPSPAASAAPETVDRSRAVPAVTPTPSTAGAAAVDADADADAAAVPGLSSDGIENLTALAAAHEQALTGQSYTVWVDLYRPLDGSSNESQIQRDVDIAVADDRYLVEATVESGYARQEILAVYADGRDRYVAERASGTTTYRRLPADESAPMVVPDPAALRRDVLTRYLATPETAVTGPVSVDGRLRYRLTGRGQPPSPALEEARNYTVTALVDPHGFVEQFAARYTVATAIGTYTVRFEVAYDRIGETTVTPPTWYEQRFAGNGTATATATTA